MARHLILVVDDEDNLRDVLVEVLKRDGHEVDSAVDGAEGLRREVQGDQTRSGDQRIGLDGLGQDETVHFWHFHIQQR